MSVARSVSWLAALVAAGCGGRSPMAPEAEARALEIVWTQAFAATETPPIVEWREDDCGGDVAGVRYQARCYSGLYLRDDRALVAWRESFFSSAYAHELMHALQWYRGVEDPEHERPEWQAVDAANATLAARGL